MAEKISFRADLELQSEPRAPRTPFHRHQLIVAGTLLLFALSQSFRFSSPTSASAKPDFSDLHYSKLCPNLSFIGLPEFASRRTRLAELLKEDSDFAAYVAEPSPNTLYYTNLSTSDWWLSERPWLIAITPTATGSHLSVLTPAFEVSRSQRLPFALSPEEREAVSWVSWQEADDPYAVLLSHLEELRQAQGATGPWSIHVEENVRQFVSYGLGAAGSQIKGTKPDVRFAALKVREQRMRKTPVERALQRCGAKVTIEAIRAVRKQLVIGMTEKDAEKLITDALTGGGLIRLDVIALFGENAALPHASAGYTKRLGPGEFVLLDVGGNLGGYQSDFTRTMLPDPAPSSWFFGLGCRHHRSSVVGVWPNARAEKIWKTVRRAQKAALAALVPSNASAVVYAADVDKAARDLITEAGWGPYFSHRVGHGIGLEVHEHPYLNSGNFQPLQPGETFSDEPGIYIEQSADTGGNGIGVRLEDMVAKTELGWELISGETLAESPWSP